MTGKHLNQDQPALRRATADDAYALTALSILSKRSNGYDDAFMQQCEAELAVTSSDLADNEWWVAETNAIVGCACLATGCDKRIGSVESFFVDPHNQRQGTGRLLWNKLRERAQGRGMQELVLDADPNAVAFYAALGFEIVGETPSGSIPGRSLPRMRILLGA